MRKFDDQYSNQFVFQHQQNEFENSQGNSLQMNINLNSDQRLIQNRNSTSQYNPYHDQQHQSPNSFYQETSYTIPSAQVASTSRAYTSFAFSQTGHSDFQQSTLPPRNADSSFDGCFPASSGQNYSNCQYNHSTYTQLRSQGYHNSGFVNQAVDFQDQYGNATSSQNQPAEPNPEHSATLRQINMNICKWIVFNNSGVSASCGRQCETAKSLGEHLRAEHESLLDKDKLICMWEGCKKDGKFTQAHKLHLHLRVHTGEEPYACNYCGTTHKRKENRDIHERTHTSNKLLVCKDRSKRLFVATWKTHDTLLHYAVQTNAK